MKAFQVRVRNLSSLQAKVKRANEQSQRGVIKALRSLRVPIRSDVKSELSRVKSGPVVTRYKPTRKVRVSNPGEPPAKDLGLLVKSIKTEVDPKQFNLVLSSSAPYAEALEKGTRRMLPRPFFAPALKRWRSRIVEAIRKGIKEGLKNV